MADPRRTVEVLLTTQNRMKSGLASGQQDLRSFAAGGMQQLDSLGAKILSLRTLVAGGILGAAINRLTTEGDMIGDTAARLAVTAREYQVLRHAAELTGGSGSDVTTAFRAMATVLYDASDASEASRRAVAALGIDLGALRGMTPYEQFQALAQALARMEDVTMRAALAQDVFGRGSQALIPMIMETRGELDALAERMDVRGQFLSDEQIARADHFRDSLSELNRAVSVAAFEALGQTIEGLTGRIMELIDSGELKSWGEEAAGAVTALGQAVGRIADVVVRHKDAVIALAGTYAGLKIALGAVQALAAVRVALGGLTVAHTAAAAATDAHTAALARQTAAQEAAAIEKWTSGINKASAATVQYAATSGTLAGQVAAVGGALNAVALAGATAFVGWNIGKLIGEATGLTDVLGDLFGKMVAADFDEQSAAQKQWVAKYGSLDAKNAQGQFFEQWRVHAAEAPSGIDERPAERAPRPMRIRGATPAEQEAARQKEAAEAEARKWQALRGTVESVWRAARVGQQTGDEAAVELWRRISGQAEVAAELTAGDIAAMGARLQEVIADDADAAVAVLRAAADAEVEAIADLAERRKTAIEDAAMARQSLAQLDLEETRQKSLAAVQAAEDAADAEAEAMRRYADRLESSANREGGRARQAWLTLVARTEEGLGPDGMDQAGRSLARREERSRERTEARLERRAREVIERMQEGQTVTREGREIARAYVAKEQEEADLRAAAEARKKAAAAERRARRERERREGMQAGYAAQDRDAERAGYEGRVRAGQQAGRGAMPGASGGVPEARPDGRGDPGASPAPVPGVEMPQGQPGMQGQDAVAVLENLLAEARGQTQRLDALTRMTGVR